ncbi:MAG: helix-turn-helix domain-containing protein [Microcoleaceae cyanobacterium]
MESQEKEKKVRELDELLKSNPDSRELKRALAVKLVIQGWSYQTIASLINVSKSYMSKWKKIYESMGL